MPDVACFENFHQADVYLLHLPLKILEITIGSLVQRSDVWFKPRLRYFLLDLNLHHEYLLHDVVNRSANKRPFCKDVTLKPLKAAHEDVVLSYGIHEVFSVLHELFIVQVLHPVHVTLWLCVSFLIDTLFGFVDYDVFDAIIFLVIIFLAFILNVLKLFEVRRILIDVRVWSSSAFSFVLVFPTSLRDVPLDTHRLVKLICKMSCLR